MTRRSIVPGVRNQNALRELIAPSVQPIAARAVLLWLVSVRPARVNTYDIRRVAHGALG
jgi:hypothetical protein